MLPGARRRARNNGVAASGSIWETRMKMDQVKGGIKVFNGDNKSKPDEDGVIKMNQKLRRNQSDGGNVEKRKRRSWKPPEAGVVDKNPIQLRKVKSEISRCSPRICNGDLKNEEEEEEEEEEDDDAIEIDDKEIDIPVEKPKDLEEDDKIHQICEVPILQNSFMDLMNKEPDLVEPIPIEVEEEMLEIESETPNRMQNIVDLVMWRDISRSAFVFGFGTFLLLSSSYTKDIDFSILSAISYLGLVYLALIFLLKSILNRGALEVEEREGRCIIGEDEAIWVLRFLLPYINEVLIKLMALFSGDPATTMKMAVVLFVMARCGTSISVWTLAKLVFFGIFTIPKVLSSYSLHLALYGKFWMERMRDGWESCTQKKPFAAAVFILIWNISSAIARIWAVFMLVVAVKLYQQYAAEYLINNNNEDDDEEKEVIVEEIERQEDSNAAAAEEEEQLRSPVNNKRSGDIVVKAKQVSSKEVKKKISREIIKKDR